LKIYSAVFSAEKILGVVLQTFASDEAHPDITGLKQKILAGFSQIFPAEKLSSVHNFSSSNSPALTSSRAH
jgi:hypothetical protein